MQLTRVRLAQVRQFRGALELGGLEPGLNLFHGPNEAGKSTVVRAIRAAFLERHRSSSVDDLLPQGESAASCSPRVEIDFLWAGQRHQLAKTFFAKKRCTYTVDGRALDGEAAEDALARLLQYGYAAKGASKPSHWGVPGLLWIQQGEGHRVAEPVGHARDHLRSALERSIGQVASSGGDELLARLRVAREQLLTPGTGRPRGELAQAAQELAAATEALQALDLQIAAYQADVDRLAALRQQQQAEQQARRWETLAQQLDAARTALEAARQMQARLQQEDSARQQLQALQQALGERLQALAAQRADRTRRADALAAAARTREDAALALAAATQRQAEAAGRARQAAQHVAQAEADELRRSLQQRLAAAEADHARLAQAVVQAAAQAEAVAGHRAEAEASALPAADLAALEAAQAALREREITQAAAATTVRLELEPGAAAGHCVRLDGQPVAASSEHRITAAASIEIAGIGRIAVVPGASDLAELARQVQAARGARDALLQRLGVASPEEARARQARHAAASAELRTATRLLALQAPQGLEALRAQLAAAAAGAAAAREQLQRLPSAAVGGPAPAEAPLAAATALAAMEVMEAAFAPGAAPSPAPRSLAEARAAQQQALAALEQAGAAQSAAAQQAASAQAREQAAQAELAALQQLLDDPATALAAQQAQARLAQATAELQGVHQRLAELQARMAQADPAALQLDVQRLQRSLELLQLAQQQRASDIGAMQGRLEQAGASGLEDQRAELQARQVQLQRRHAELETRAAALDLLVQRLEARRQALTRRLQAPLQARLDHYLHLLMPGVQLLLDEGLAPQELTRGTPLQPPAAGAAAGEASAAPAGGPGFSFEQLSHGAQEQAGLISRLAYADLLREAGTPTLVILDDALVHSDAARLDRMQRVLYDAATRHQVLLFTCHPERWAALGAAPRELRSGLQAAA